MMYFKPKHHEQIRLHCEIWFCVIDGPFWESNTNVLLKTTTRYLTLPTDDMFVKMALVTNLTVNRHGVGAVATVFHCSQRGKH